MNEDTVDDRIAAAWARKAAAVRQRHQADPELRAREAEARRQRQQADPKAARAREAAAKRARRQADPELRAREAAAVRKCRQADPEAARAREAESRNVCDLYFTDHKAVIRKGKRSPKVKVIYDDE